ncbi:uncharacterized protein CIMG_13461 [Coccidioides immitis RS]|uniref:Aminoglycoside phosphotransferase domain-containing protein n=1 Tax=Coccidioides immitis (strain RS) TaxID=246410 RepID=A0A0D8JY12_COCIM|nr:uncharacterized protein CIMG_13461 [Coccidioides immitis RS]KJF61143.1 hypothetical protein CIMG_13461 [Coccidioides immitis RS]
MVFRCDGDIVVKAIRNTVDYTEYIMLQYLEKHKPTISAPRPLELLHINNVFLIFMSYIPEQTLVDVWLELDIAQKRLVQEQLGQILTDLRSLPHLDRMLLGGVGSEDCKNVRSTLFQQIQCIFTHGDLRPDNITIKACDKEIQVTGLLDWEYSRFYPEYYKLVKYTNGLSLSEDDDWCLFMLKCILLECYAWWWLLDNV